ncbi:Pentatricopeptide repeat [Macleaya cordata]|uniref:Pentatricopeptide repeat n=1 Tax=Macleaya cordata TaxID=56857 RepID=A0A200PMY3_MACCD|nr:Pentatricopeptide repeat [Macleaya cordata]
MPTTSSSSSSSSILEWIPTTVGFLLTKYPRGRSLNMGRSIHAFLLKQPDSSWWARDVYVQNHLLIFYGKCKKMKWAQKLFDEMPKRNTVTWSSLISAYDQCGKSERALEIFSLMVSDEDSSGPSSSPPNQFTYNSAITACAKQEHLIKGMQIHSHALRRGYVSHLMVSNVLISLYMACGIATEAQLIFQEIPEPDQVSWNSLVSGLSQNGFSQAAFQTFQRMREWGFEITSFALSAFAACLEDERDGKKLHGLATKINLNAEDFTGCAIIRMYSEFRNMDDAVRAFEELSSKDVASWNSLIEGYAESDNGETGLQVFYDFMKSELEPDEITMTAIMSICTSLVMLDYGKQVHALSVKTGLNRRIRVENSLLDMYSKCGSLEDGIKAFRFIEKKTLVSWTAIIGGLGNHGKAVEAKELFEEMKREGLKPNKVTYTCILSACRHAGQLDLGLAVFNSMEIEPESEHLKCMVHMLAGGGRFQEAEEFIQRSPAEHRDLLWLTFLVACKNSGEWERGVNVAEKIKARLPAESFTSVLLSNVFAAAERWEEVAKLREEMRKRGKKKEPGCSWIQVDNMVQVFGMQQQKM